MDDLTRLEELTGLPRDVLQASSRQFVTSAVTMQWCKIVSKVTTSYEIMTCARADVRAPVNAADAGRHVAKLERAARPTAGRV